MSYFKTLYFASIIVILGLLLNNCGQCQTDCLHGELSENCKCNCDEGWIGVECDQPANFNLISAIVNYPGYFEYETVSLDLIAKIHSSGTDTLFVDSETAFNEWMYFRLIVDDLNKISKKSFPITHSSLINEVWFTHKNPSITTNTFSPLTSKPISGYFEIDTFSNFPLLLKAKFYASLKDDQSFDTCRVHEGVINYMQ